MNESTIGGLPSQQVQPKGDGRGVQPQPAERPELERLQQEQAKELQKPVESERQNKTGDPTEDQKSGVVVDLKTIPRAALPTVTGVSPARALSYAVAALKVELSTLFVILGQTGETSSGVAEKVGNQIEQDALAGDGNGASVVQKVSQALDGFNAPPITTTSGGAVGGLDSVDVSISVQDLQIRLGAAGAGVAFSYGAIDVSVERTAGAVLASGDLAAYAREITGSEIDLAKVESGLLFTGSSEAVRSQAIALGTRPEVARELPPAARGNEPQRVATYGPQAVRQDQRGVESSQERDLNVLQRRIDQAVTSLLLVNGGTVREAEGEKGLTLLSLDAVRPLFSRRDGQVQLAPGLVQFAQAAERATLPRDRVTSKDFDTLA